MEGVGFVLKININFDSFACGNSYKGLPVFILDANLPGSKWMEPRHLTSSVTRSQMLLQDPSLQTPHQRKMFLLVYPWRPTLHTRATKLTRCSSLQQRPLQETSSYRRPAWNLPTWATFLVKHMMLSFNIQINKVCVEGGMRGGIKALIFFSSFPGILITFTTVGLLVLIALTLKFFASPHVEKECEQPTSMFPS